MPARSVVPAVPTDSDPPSSPLSPPRRRGGRRKRAGGDAASFDRFKHFATRAGRFAAKEADARAEMQRLVDVDFEERQRRNRRRAELVGEWIISARADWFAIPENRAAFDSWLAAAPARNRDAPLFRPGADADLLTQAVVDRLLAEADAAGGPAAPGDPD